MSNPKNLKTMKTKIILTSFAFAVLLSTYGQNAILELSFTAIESNEYVQLDSIKVTNQTHEGDTTLYWPDTVLILNDQAEIPEMNSSVGNLHVFHNYPNPMVDHTTLSFYIPEQDKISMIITDMMGRVIIKTEKILDKGIHSFRFTPSGEYLYFFTVQWRGKSSSIKILQPTSTSNRPASLEYIGSEKLSSKLKATEDILNFAFNPGDTLIYIGFKNGLQSGILDTPETNIDYKFQFATNISCPDTPTVEYEGQVYNTIQIFSQCWLKENLNVGSMIQGDQEMTDNSILEKYCYNNEPDSCAIYGGLYQWDEMMQYTTEQGSQGICPSGWHIPTDDEWKLLEGAVDSQYGIGDQAWDEYGWRGSDAGANLKASSGWYEGGDGTDLFGFSGQPSGTRDHDDGTFNVNGEVAMSWSSTESEPGIVFYRFLFYDDSEAIRGITVVDYGFSVRCLKD